MLVDLLRRTHESEIGISRLTIVIITIACFAVGGLLAYTTLSSENDPITVYANEASGTLELRGTVYGKCDTAEGKVSELIFTLAIPNDGTPVNLTCPPDNVVEISYIDANQQVDGLQWTCEEYIAGDGDAMLEDGETFLVTGILGDVLDPGLGAGTAFVVEVKTPDGEVLTFKRVTPDELNPVINLQ